MSTILEIPKLVSSVVLDPPLTDEEFEKLSASSELVKFERAKDGKIIVNAPTGGDSSSGNSEITHQLRAWWKTQRTGKVYDSNAGFFLPDGSSLSPHAAYATAEQVKGLSHEDRKHFGHFAPAFVFELLSASDSMPKTMEKMESWLSNGTKLAWLVDPYKRQVWVFEAGKSRRLESSDRVIGSGPVSGFVLELRDIWSEFED